MNQPLHMIALEKANRIRLARAESKREIYEGHLSLADALEMEHMQSMTVFELLKAQWRWGDTRAHKTLCHLGMSETQRVDSLAGPRKQRLLEACDPSERSAA